MDKDDNNRAPADRLPEGLMAYRRTADFAENNIPAGLRKAHATKDGSWGLIRVSEGELRYRVVDERRLASERSPDMPPGIIEPTIFHEVEPVGSVRFHVEFLRQKQS